MYLIPKISVITQSDGLSLISHRIISPPFGKEMGKKEKVWISSSIQASCNPLDHFWFSAPSHPSFRDSELQRSFQADDRSLLPEIAIQKLSYKPFRFGGAWPKDQIWKSDKVSVVPSSNHQFQSPILSYHYQIINLAFRQLKSKIERKKKKKNQQMRNVFLGANWFCGVFVQQHADGPWAKRVPEKFNLY